MNRIWGDLMLLFRRGKNMTAGEENIIIRHATPRDAKGIVELLKSVVEEKIYVLTEFVNITEEEEKNYLRNLRPDRELVLVAEYDSRIIGILTLNPYRRSLSPKVQHVGEMGISIHRDFRGRGIGQKLIEYSKVWAQINGYEKICLSVFSSNERAINLYKKCGFVEEGRRKNQFKIEKTYADEILMCFFIERG